MASGCWTKKKELTNTIEDLDTAIEDAEEAITTTKAEIEALSDGIRMLDHSVEDATEERKAQNEAYQALMASDTAAKELIGMAKNRLQKFYNPKLAKFVQVSQHDQTAE